MELELVWNINWKESDNIWLKVAKTTNDEWWLFFFSKIKKNNKQLLPVKSLIKTNASQQKIVFASPKLVDKDCTDEIQI